VGGGGGLDIPPTKKGSPRKKGRAKRLDRWDCWGKKGGGTVAGRGPSDDVSTNNNSKNGGGASQKFRKEGPRSKCQTVIRSKRGREKGQRNPTNFGRCGGQGAKRRFNGQRAKKGGLAKSWGLQGKIRKGVRVVIIRLRRLAKERSPVEPSESSVFSGGRVTRKKSCLP